VAGGRGGRSTRQYEVLERRQAAVQFVERALQRLDVVGVDDPAIRDTEFATHIEQRVLNIG